jgi:tetratricopeptide (TPR) repeat protein
VSTTASHTEGKTGYTTREVAEVLGLDASRIRTFAPFLELERGPGREFRFSFRDIVLLRAVRDLLAAEVPPRKIRRALERLREQLPRGRPLSAVHIAADGDRVIVREEGSTWEPESQQLVLDFSVAELAARAAPFAIRAAEELARTQDLGADGWFDLGYDLETVAPVEAAMAYRRALELDPAHVEANLNLGRLAHEQGDVTAAEMCYRRALAADPQCAVAHYNLGVALQDRHDLDGAIDAYRIVIRIDPNYAEAHYNLARIYEGLDRPAEALRHFAHYRRLRG